MRHHRPAAALLLFLLCLLLPAAAGAGGSRADRGPAASGGRALRTKGYRAATVRCVAGTRRAACRWSATRTRSRARCHGRLTVARAPVRGRRVRVTRTHCRAAPPAKTTAYGFNVYTTPETVALQKTTGAQIQRLNISWYQVQAAPGAWDWSVYDQQYKLIVDAGLKPLVMLFAAPCWARPRTGCAFLGPPDPAFDPEWTDFVRRAAQRYPAAIGIEVWNEPNLDTEWAPAADPARYVRLLREAYTTIKAVDPAMPVVSGGLYGSTAEGRVPGGIGDKAFLQEMFAAGAGPVMDGIGFHPYPQRYAADGSSRWDPAVMEEAVQRIRSVRDAAGASQPLWLTELGESTTTQHYFPAAVSPTQQASDLLRMVRAAAAAPDVPVMLIHTLVDAAANLPEDALGAIVAPTTGLNLTYNRINSGFGIFTAEQRPKPAACVLSHEFGGSLAC